MEGRNEKYGWNIEWQYKLYEISDIINKQKKKQLKYAIIMWHTEGKNIEENKKDNTEVEEPLAEEFDKIIS